MNTQGNTPELELVESSPSMSPLESISRAEVDVQISTAHKYPKHTTPDQLLKVKGQIITFATLDEETARGCFYSLPRGGKTIQGPSVRLAEIAVSCYGNLRAGSRVIESVTTGDSPYVVIQSVCHDLERNVAVTIEKRRRITKKRNASKIDEDDINLACNAGASVAFRDAVFKVVPLAIIKPAYEQARKVAVGDARTIADRRAKAIESFAKLGVTKDRVLARVERDREDAIDLDNIELLIGLFTAIKDGETTIEEAFPPIVKTRASVISDPKDAKEEAAAGLAPEPAPEVMIREALKFAGITEARLAKYLQGQGLDVTDSLSDMPPHVLTMVKTSLRDIIAVIAVEDAKKPKAEPKEKKAEAPKAEAPKKEAAVGNFNYMKALTGLMKLDGIDEAEILKIARELGIVDESLSSLEEVNIQNPKALKLIHDQFASIAQQAKREGLL